MTVERQRFLENPEQSKRLALALACRYKELKRLRKNDFIEYVRTTNQARVLFNRLNEADDKAKFWDSLKPKEAADIIWFMPDLYPKFSLADHTFEEHAEHIFNHIDKWFPDIPYRYDRAIVLIAAGQVQNGIVYDLWQKAIAPLKKVTKYLGSSEI